LRGADLSFPEREINTWKRFPRLEVTDPTGGVTQYKGESRSKLYYNNPYHHISTSSVSSDFMSILDGLIPEVIPGHKMNMDPIFNGYVNTGT
jgi:N-acetyl-beta-hexosaminidase